MVFKGGDSESLHIASSGLKALCSKLTCDGIEACRKACGGHGYLASSGLVELLGTYKQNATVEGENYMIAYTVHLADPFTVQWGGGFDAVCACMRSETGSLRRDGRDRGEPVI